MKFRHALLIAALFMLLPLACESEHYDDVPVDIQYGVSALGDMDVSIQDTTYHVDQVGIAIGSTEITLCDHHEVARLDIPSLRDLFVPRAWAHSPSTPTSSGIPIILATGADTTDLLVGAVRPVRGVEICAVTVHLHPADADAELIDTLPDIQGSTSAAKIDGTWHKSTKEGARTFTLDTPIDAGGHIQFDITFDNDAWQTELSNLSSTIEDADALSDALRDAVLQSLTLQIKKDGKAIVP